jgi:hypothetical protein
VSVVERRGGFVAVSYRGRYYGAVYDTFRGALFVDDVYGRLPRFYIPAG